jgi:hypothetical protein
MFDPTLPSNNAPLVSAVMRTQLNALNDDIQTRCTVALMNATVSNAVGTTSSNSNSVGTLSMSADGNYNSSQLQDIINKLDELINALRR